MIETVDTVYKQDPHLSGPSRKSTFYKVDYIFTFYIHLPFQV
jgi:hypothetical protein